MARLRLLLSFGIAMVVYPMWRTFDISIDIAIIASVIEGAFISYIVSKYISIAKEVDNG